MKEWAYTVYGEDSDNWTPCESKEEAIEQGLCECDDGQKEYHIGSIEPVKLPLISGEFVLNHLMDEVYETAPEGCEWEPKVTDDQEDELCLKINAVIKEWIEKHGLKPEWFHIGKIEEIKVT